MDSVLVSVILLALSGVQQPSAAPPAPTVHVRAGEDATLQCPLLDGSNITAVDPPAGPSTVSWYRKAAGQGPELLVSFSSANGSVRYGGGVGPDKVSAAADGALLLRGSDRSDSAVYYCGLSHRCWVVSSSPSGPSPSGQSPSGPSPSGQSPSGPSIQVLTSVQPEDPESPRLLVCLLKGLKSPQQPVLWWLDGSTVSAAGLKGTWTKSNRGYSTTSVWTVPAADWRPTSSYWCGTIQDGHQYRQKLCSQD
ncbi:immunoglobulin lambda-1 light chain-like [Nematolebias whitei]|uniref:immunoglobulin lambda-1 light chain-like n=1 Tax=Nematolebias whitei TaxID=451745 RepID=UPI00189C191F|nr:immunoglobulin lambda-1 light chain-like [Nematolebias whitei]